ncbi:hypothetical protein C1N71_02340 [Agrococcus sp. SGAir0287]|nr:hypothetical protein C1N71_02340 [Agrococcus sp. SGAir0287]
MRTQVRIGDARVDLLVGDRLVIECDGGEHHAGWEAQAADRARDGRLVTLGSLVVRLTDQQIVDDWATVETDPRPRPLGSASPPVSCARERAGTLPRRPAPRSRAHVRRVSRRARTAAAPSRPRRRARGPTGSAGAGRAARPWRRARHRRPSRRSPAPARPSR